MTVTFSDSVPLAESMCFEDVYEENLRLDRGEKQTIIDDAIAVWMFVDGALAGETYGISPRKLDEPIEDYDGGGHGVIYCFSTTMLPSFRRKGLGKILKAFWLGRCKESGFEKVIGHATSPAMVEVNRFFGATFGAIHRGWYGTRRVAHFYELPL